MARIVGGIATSHVPAIGGAIAKGKQNDPYGRPFYSAFPPLHHWLAEVKPDLAVMFYNDHGLNFFLDKMPTFAIGAADEYRNADEGWGLPVQHPLPSAARVFKLGLAVGRAIAEWQNDARVLIKGTGGLSHQLDGARAGFINKAFDRLCLDSLVDNPAALTRYSTAELVEPSDTQGVEILNWIAMRGALTGRVRLALGHYHVPISNTATGVMLLENVEAGASV